MTAAAQSANAAAPSLPAADAVMRRASGENFSVASLLLGSTTRRHLRAIYGFARLVDQIGDDAPGNRLELLDGLEEDLDRVFEPGAEPADPLLRRLSVTVGELDLPREPFVRLIEANRVDQRVARYETLADVLAYCELSANPVGELVLHVFRAATPDRIALSNRICSALQLIEHWQDVGEDFERGRIYLPIEDLVHFGVATSDLALPRAPDRLRRLLAYEVERARELLDAGAPLVRRLRGRARIAVAGYVGGGRATLDAFAAGGYDVLSATPRARRLGRLRAVAATLGGGSWRP